MDLHMPKAKVSSAHVHFLCHLYDECLSLKIYTQLVQRLMNCFVGNKAILWRGYFMGNEAIL